MSGTTQDLDRDPTAPEALPPTGGRSTGRSRTRTMWILIALSLVPGGAAAMSREWWHGLPPGVRLSAYILSGVLIVAACSLILMGDDKPANESTSRPDSSGSGP